MHSSGCCTKQFLDNTPLKGRSVTPFEEGGIVAFISVGTTSVPVVDGISIPLKRFPYGGPICQAAI